ncbi:MAG: TonB-dependent receptor [Emcibacter sp.]|nr:TonB-dependent receptor [Emcibacter sp.]
MKRSLLLISTALGFTASALTVSATAAAAEEKASSMQLEEIVVVSRRREERFQDLPASVTVLSASTIENAGIARAEDFIALTPGVTMVNAIEAGDTQVSIRGINGARDAEASFGFIVDGILMTNPSALNREFTDLKQIEVFKGPQGAIYGRNAAAGAIIISTRKPGNELEGEVKFTAGNNNSYFISGTVGGPIVEDKVAYRVHANYRSTDGFFRNSFQDDSKIVDDFKNYNINGRVVIEVNENTSLDLKARYGEVEAASITFNAVFNLPDFDAAVPGINLFEDVNEHEFVFQPNIDPFNNQRTIELSAKIDQDYDWGSLTAWALYSDIDQDFGADGTSGAFGFFNNEPTCRDTVAALTGVVDLPLPTFFGGVPEFSFLGPYTPSTCDGTQYQVRNQKDVSFELRLASPGDQRLRWSVGAYYLDLEREVGINLAIDTGNGIIRNLFNPIGSTNPTEQLVHDQFDSTVFAIFGQLAYDVTEEIEFSLALRYDNENRKVKNLVPVDARSQYVDFDNDGSFDGGAPLNPGLDPTVNPGGVLPDQQETFQELQPKVSLTWDVSNDTTLFTSWGVGFKSGGFNSQGSKATVDLFFNDLLGANVLIEDSYKKETSSAFEAGFKSRLFDGRVTLDGAGYITNTTDMQFFEFFVGSFGLARIVSNIDKVQIKGAEVAMTVKATDSLNLFFGGSVIDSEIKENSARPNTVGNKSPNTADYNLNFGADYRFAVTDVVDFFTRADYVVVGPMWFHTVQNNTRPTTFGLADLSKTRRNAFGVLNLRAGFQGDNWSVMGYARNLTNNVHIEEVINAPEFGGVFVHPGQPRSYGIELSYKF